MVVIHHTAGEWAGDLRVLRGRTQRKVSAHWLVGRTEGQGIVAIVPEERAAWHAGKCRWSDAAGRLTSAVNDISLGIELSRPKTLPDPTHFQYEACAQLCRYALANYPLITWERIVGHYAVAWPRGRKTDPNPGFGWERLKEMVMGTPVTLEMDGTKLDDGRLVDDTTWVPLRVVAEAADLKVTWVPGDPPKVKLERERDE